MRSDVSDALSDASLTGRSVEDVSVEDVAEEHVGQDSAASQSISDEVDIPSASDRQGADSIIDEDDAIQSAGAGSHAPPHQSGHLSEIGESIDESNMAGARRAATPLRAADSIAYSMDFDDAPDDASAAAGSVSQVDYSDDFEQASASHAPQQQSVAISEAYSQDFERINSSLAPQQQSVAISEAYSEDFEQANTSLAPQHQSAAISEAYSQDFEAASDVSRMPSMIRDSMGPEGSRREGAEVGVGSVSEELAAGTPPAVRASGRESGRSLPHDSDAAYSNTFEADTEVTPACLTCCSLACLAFLGLPCWRRV